MSKKTDLTQILRNQYPVDGGTDTLGTQIRITLIHNMLQGQTRTQSSCTVLYRHVAHLAHYLWNLLKLQCFPNLDPQALAAAESR